MKSSDMVASRGNVLLGVFIDTPLPLLLYLKKALAFDLPLIKSLGRLTPISTVCIFLLIFLEALKLLLHLNITSLVDRRMTHEDMALVDPLPENHLLYLLISLLLTP